MMTHGSRWSFIHHIYFTSTPLLFSLPSIAVLPSEEEIDITADNADFQDEQYSDAPQSPSHLEDMFRGLRVCILTFVGVSQLYIVRSDSYGRAQNASSAYLYYTNQLHGFISIVM